MAVKSRDRNSAPETSDVPDTRRKLVVAAIMTIERYGVDGATVRRIVAEAGVNIAAVNYHFGSKEILLRKALDATVHEAFTKSLTELEQFIAQEGGDIPAGARSFFRDYLPNAFGWARIAVAHLREALLNQDYSGGAIAESQRFISQFYGLVRPAMRGPDAAARLAVEHVWGTIFFLSLLPQIFGESAEVYRSELMVEEMARTLFG